MKRGTLVGIGISAAVLVTGLWFVLAPRDPPARHLKVVERDELRVEAPKLDLLHDDRLEDKTPAFDPALVDSRPLPWMTMAWEVNASDAVVRLDVATPASHEAHLLQVFSSFAAAARALEPMSPTLLPSVNQSDARAKQFDDGLMAAVMLATATADARGRAPAILGRLMGRLARGSAERAWVFAALETGGYLSAEQLAERPSATVALLQEFLASAEAKPIAFYSWTPDLERLWRFYKFLQQPLPGGVRPALRKALLADDALAREYRALIEFFARVSNPPTEGTLLDPREGRVIPPMGTRENALFLRLFGTSGLPEGVELMQEFVKAIRSGKVSLEPAKGGGWYDYQVHALETFLLPERGKENQKLLLTKAYKQRMLEAFKALLTKRRETQALFAAVAKGEAMKSAPPPLQLPAVSPRLRVEPNPTYFLRMARSYAFIESALQAFLTPEERARVTGLREGGQRESPLLQELAAMKRHFYGLHLVAAEDIGMKPDLLAGELDDPAAAKIDAERYLAKWREDRDLAADTRVCAPVWGQGTRYRLWCTLGVKGIKLTAWYVRPPRVRLAGSSGEWTVAKEMHASRYLVLVDEFAEVVAASPLSRSELRAVADREKTRDRIVEALAAGAK